MVINNALIIEDEPDICMLLKNYLKNKSNFVAFSTTLKEGLAKFALFKPNLLIIDHNLPDGHGIEYLEKFKKMDSSLRIVVISAMSNYKNKALECGADFFIEKPISFNELNDILVK
jgi:DNA-binding response OmpR family regulator